MIIDYRCLKALKFYFNLYCTRINVLYLRVQTGPEQYLWTHLDLGRWQVEYLSTSVRFYYEYLVMLFGSDRDIQHFRTVMMSSMVLFLRYRFVVVLSHVLDPLGKFYLLVWSQISIFVVEVYLFVLNVTVIEINWCKTNVEIINKLLSDFTAIYCKWKEHR